MWCHRTLVTPLMSAQVSLQCASRDLKANAVDESEPIQSWHQGRPQIRGSEPLSHKFSALSVIRLHTHRQILQVARCTISKTFSLDFRASSWSDHPPSTGPSGHRLKI